MTVAGVDGQALALRYEADGICTAPPVIPAAFADDVALRMAAVIAGEYDAGGQPNARSTPPGKPGSDLVKIDQAHVCDETIRAAVSSPAIGRWAAAATGAGFVQVWATQLLYKPPGAATAGTVGWHQDLQYWGPSWDADPRELFTAWLAISDVTPEAGPVRFVRGSQSWGLLNGNFWGHDLAEIRANLALPDGAAWDEIEAILPKGAISLHQSLVVHGSGPNVSATPRLGFAIHLRTDRATPRPGAGEAFGFDLDDTLNFPVVYAR